MVKWAVTKKIMVFRILENREITWHPSKSWEPWWLQMFPTCDKCSRHATFNNLSVLSGLTHLAGVTPVDGNCWIQNYCVHILLLSSIVYSSFIVFPRNYSLGQPISQLTGRIIAEINFFPYLMIVHFIYKNTTLKLAYPKLQIRQIVLISKRISNWNRGRENFDSFHRCLYEHLFTFGSGGGGQIPGRRRLGLEHTLDCVIHVPHQNFDQNLKFQSKIR